MKSNQKRIEKLCDNNTMRERASTVESNQKETITSNIQLCVFVFPLANGFMGSNRIELAESGWMAYLFSE